MTFFRYNIQVVDISLSALDFTSCLESIVNPDFYTLVVIPKLRGIV